MNNKMNGFPQLNMSQFKKTEPLIKWSIVFLFGILPMVLLISLVSSTDSVNLETMFSMGYGEMWGLGIGVIILMMILVSIVSYFSSSVGNDVIPQTAGFLFMGMGFFVIPLTGWASLAFILIAPILYVFGFFLAFVGTSIVFIINLNRQMKSLQEDPEVKKQMQEMQSMFKDGSQPNPPKQNMNIDKDEYQDNPYVDIDPEDEDEE